MKDLLQKPLSKLNRHLGLIKEAVHHAALLEMARQRVFTAGILMALFFTVIGVRLVDVMLIQTSKRQMMANLSPEEQFAPRADIYDRNGNIIATHLVTASVYATPKVVLNAEDAAKKLAKLFPNIGYQTLYNRLSSQKGFIWLARHISPSMQQKVHELGLPGIYLQKDAKRVFPYANLMSHAIGYCGIDNAGLAGVERYFDKSLSTSEKPLRLSLDVRLQHIVRDVLMGSIEEFKAVGANAMVMDIKTGEMLAMVSVPDFNPNQMNSTSTQTTFNTNTLGVYEPGSTFKILNTAIALETGHATPRSIYDARTPIKIGRFTITDFRAKNRELSLTESFVYSSNIASIKIAQQFGIATQKAYFNKFGVMKPTSLEIPEVGSPLIPKQWSEATLMTASYGYGIAVTPLQMMSIVGTIINNGIPVKPTLVHKDSADRAAAPQEDSIISAKTSQTMRELMRAVALYGSARKADVAGYEVIAKTGTAYQNEGGGYDGKRRTTFCIGAFPFKDPQVMVMVMLNSPKATPATYNYATAGWNATPTMGKIIERIAPILGIPVAEEPTPMKYVHWSEGGANLVQTAHKVTE